MHSCGRTTRSKIQHTSGHSYAVMKNHQPSAYYFLAKRHNTDIDWLCTVVQLPVTCISMYSCNHWSHSTLKSCICWWIIRVNKYSNTWYCEHTWRTHNSKHLCRVCQSVDILQDILVIYLYTDVLKRQFIAFTVCRCQPWIKNYTVSGKILWNENQYIQFADPTLSLFSGFTGKISTQHLR